MGKGERTRAQIIQEAAEIFNRKGYAGAAISDVMEATGLEKGGIYRHFTSKDQLALEAFQYAIDLANSRYLAAIRSSHHALDRLIGIVDTFRELERGRPIQGGCPLMNTAIDSDDSHPELRRMAASALEYWHGMIEAIVQRGIERGELQAGTEGKLVATRMIAAMEGGLMMARLTDDSDYMDRTVAGLRNLIEDLAA